MNYSIVIPAYNEADNIAQTLLSVSNQSVLPTELIVVNDGSTDQTAAIVQDFSQKYPWVRLINNDSASKHLPGAKIVRAFYKGFENLRMDYDVIVKLDADLILPEHYFEGVLKLFREDATVGIAGGINLVERGGNWVYENFADKDHVRGAFKAYRRACFEAIGGLKESLGWDSVDELLARFHGWQIKTDPTLIIKHVRARGQSTGFIKVMVKMGRAMYRMRYGLFITTTSALKAGLVNRPYLLTGAAVIIGWIFALVFNDPYMVSKHEGRFIRQYRWEKMLSKLKVRRRTP